MNKKKFINAEGDIKIGKVYQKRMALWYGGCYTYSTLHKLMKREGFIPCNK